MLLSEKPYKHGFNTIFCNEDFKCAFITASKDYSFDAVNEMKRHNNTNEIFVLISGSAVMITMENDKIEENVLKIGEAYNVSMGTWHYLAVSDDAKVFVVERADTNATNSDTITLEKAYVIKQCG